MGTSKSYQLPHTSKWATVNRAVGQIAACAYSPNEAVPILVESFVRAGTNGERALLSAGHELLSRAAMGLSTWVADWHDYGLAEACQRLHVELRPGMSVSELAGLLVQAMAPIGVLRQDVAIRRAICDVIDELLEAASGDNSDVGGLALATAGEDAYGLVVHLVGYYIYEVLVSSLDGELLQQLSDREADELADGVKSFLLVRVQEMISSSKMDADRHPLRELREDDVTDMIREVYNVFLGR